MATLGDLLFPVPRLAADPAYFATAQPWPPASAYPDLWPTCLTPVRVDDSDVSSLKSDDSPSARRKKLGPTDHQGLTKWRERCRRMKLRLWNLESCRTRPRTSWEVAYLKLSIEDMRQAIARAAETLGRRPRIRRGVR